MLKTISFLAAVIALSGCTGAEEPRTDETGAVMEALAPSGSNAQFVATANLPTSLHPGERRLVQVTLRNTGASSPANDWTSAYAFSTSNPSWGWSYAYSPSTVVVGQSHTFTFPITAPPASSSFEAQMLALGAGSFGDVVTLPVTIDAATTPEWGCTLQSSTLPTTLAAGENRFVTLTVQNTGTDTWAASATSLNSQDAPVNLWGQTTAPVTTAVVPGATASFGFGIKAPATAGTYTFSREMFTQTAMGRFRSWGFCVSQPISVVGTPALDATGSVQTSQATMAPGEVAIEQLSVTNTGSETWQPGGNYLLYSLNTPTNLWGVTQAAVSTATPPGQAATFYLRVVAPSAPGAYVQRWQMRKVTGLNGGFFGTQASVPITVSASATPLYGATVASQAVPLALSSGQAATFAITMKNTGAKSWSGSNFILYSTSSPTNLWNVTGQALGATETVAPGASRAFTLSVKAPPTAGTFSSSWQMRKLDDIGLFGQTAASQVVVSAACTTNHTPGGTYSVQLSGGLRIERVQPDQSCPVDTVTESGAATLTLTPVPYYDVVQTSTPPYYQLVDNGKLYFSLVLDAPFDLNGFGLTHLDISELYTTGGPWDPATAGQPASIQWYASNIARRETSVTINITVDTATGSLTAFDLESTDFGPCSSHTGSFLGTGTRSCSP
ncbi:MAG TPA: NBR1-Ig-like domain-containing protein [Polyangiaceae bacterium]|nr:NBR1-Ig-like domain-containing protein [Polyangiaceae bacterium]